MYVCTYIYIYVCICTYTYIYNIHIYMYNIYIQTWVQRAYACLEREEQARGEREREHLATGESLKHVCARCRRGDTCESESMYRELRAYTIYAYAYTYRLHVAC